MGNCCHREIVPSQGGKLSSDLLVTINSARVPRSDDKEMDTTPPKRIKRKNYDFKNGNTQVVPTTVIHSVVEFDTSHAFIPDIMSHPSEFIRGIWSKHHRPLPEYEEAASLIILEPQWISQTVLLRNLESIKREFQSNPTLEEVTLDDFVQKITIHAVRRTRCVIAIFSTP